MTTRTLHARAWPLFFLLLSAGCRGPDPVVEEVKLTPPEAAGRPYRLEAVIQNRGGGEGQATVEARLRETSRLETIQKEEQIELGPHERTRVVMELPAPPGSYTPEVKVEYPPQ